MIKVKHKNIIKMDVVIEIKQMKQVFHKHRNMKKMLLLWFRNTYFK